MSRSFGATFPGEFAGASLKPAPGAPHTVAGRPFPGEFAGASLKQEVTIGVGVPRNGAFPGEFAGASLKHTLAVAD